MTAARVNIAPSNGVGQVRLDKVIKVRASQGTLSMVKVTSAAGTPLAGTLSPDQLSWVSTGKLAPGTRYQVAVQAAATNGSRTSSTSSFSTLVPKGTVSAYIEPGDGWTAGVGMPIVVNFSQDVATQNRAGVEAVLKVNTAASIQGSWRWFSARQVQWRPEVYWPVNTKVNVTADLRGVELAPGVWATANTPPTSASAAR